MAEIETGRRRVTYLDGLRGVAAFLVVFFHASSALIPAIVFGTSRGGIAHVFYATPILDVLMQGNFMVCIFYVLSGFALSYATLSRGGAADAVSGLVRRYPRLALPTTIATLLAFLMLRLRLFPVVEAGAISHSSWLASFFQFHSSLVGAGREGAVGVFGPRGSAYDPPLWTMHNELRGSFLVFAVLILAPRRWLRIAAYVALAFLTYHSYLLDFVAGMAICEATLAYHRRADGAPARERRWWWIAVLGVIGLYGLVLGSYPTPSTTMPRFYDRLLPHIYGSGPFAQQIGTQALGAILVLVAVVSLVPLQRIFETRPMQFLGRISFALYLFHFLVLASLGARTLILLNGPLPYAAAAFLAFGITVAVSIAGGWAFSLLIDEPAVRRTKPPTSG